MGNIMTYYFPVSVVSSKLPSAMKRLPYRANKDSVMTISSKVLVVSGETLQIRVQRIID
jgi:hypothetical protein